MHVPRGASVEGPVDRDGLAHELAVVHRGDGGRRLLLGLVLHQRVALVHRRRK